MSAEDTASPLEIERARERGRLSAKADIASGHVLWPFSNPGLGLRGARREIQIAWAEAKLAALIAAGR